MKTARRPVIRYIDGNILGPRGGPYSRPCPRCEVSPGTKCRRWIAALVGGEDMGGGYWKQLAQPHPERKSPGSRKAVAQ